MGLHHVHDIGVRKLLGEPEVSGKKIIIAQWTSWLKRKLVIEDSTERKNQPMRLF